MRLLDTRAGEGNCDSVGTPIIGGTSITKQARITCEGITIPANAQALVGTVTAVNLTSQAGYLTLYPNGVPTPLNVHDWQVLSKSTARSAFLLLDLSARETARTAG